jgi:hypothetical protein
MRARKVEIFERKLKDFMFSLAGGSREMFRRETVLVLVKKKVCR